MLIKAVGGCAHDEEKNNILRSWLTSVSNPVFSPDELTKTVKKFKTDAQRLEVLEEISKPTQTLSVQETVALLKVFQTPTSKMTALPIIANKLEYQSESDLEPLLKLFTVAKDKESVRAMFESTAVNLEEASLEQNIKQDATSAMVQPPVSQQATPQPQVQQPATPQPEVIVFNFAQFKKKLRAAKEVEEKMEVLETELSSAFDVTLTVKEIQTIAATFPNDSNRVTAIVLLSEYIPSFDVTEFASLIAKIPDIDSKLKVVEACCHKLAYALPWDCEPIYKVLSVPEKKTLARELIASAREANQIQTSVESSLPTPEMLVKGISGSVPDEEKVDIIHSWLASVPNPVFSPEVLAKILKTFKTDERRLQILEELFNFSETLDADQMIGLMRVFSTPAVRLTALPAVANKMIYHFDSELDALDKVFLSSTDKNTAYSIIESTSVKQQGQFQPGEPDVSNLITKIKRCSQSEDKHRIINSDVFTLSNIVLSAQECLSILESFLDPEDCIKAFEAMAAYIPSFAVSDVSEILKLVTDTDEMKVIEICSKKLVYTLPFDCEPIYYTISRGKTKTMARQIISSQEATPVDPTPCIPR
ncbi:hypothetical protein GEMRC1_005100 [Eukaryota sp. GEM-RC1]